MRVLGIPESEIATAVRAVSDDEALDHEVVLDRFARAAWSGVAEPGDGDAGRLVTACGASGALDRLIRRADEASIRAALRDGGDDDPIDIAAALERWRPRLVAGQVLRSLRQAARFGARLIVPGESEWPTGLADLGSHAPLALWVRGPALTTADRSVALVGARAATGYGEHVAIEAASGLVELGFAIVSGGAYGIDGSAHRSALASSGATVAFLAGGVDRLYPSGHESLLSQIAAVGALVSEVPCGTAPTKWRFLQRNRLIAAASSATVVVEAGQRSGSLNTAGHAAQLGRPLGAVPGPVTSSASAGCHRMIREYDAVCVTDASEMAELVDGPRGADTAGAARAPDPDGARMRILDALGTRIGRPVDQVAALAGLAPERVRSLLGSLDLEGSVVEGSDGWRRR
jgi:DNA processing protein